MKPILSTVALLCLAAQAADVKTAMDATAAWNRLKSLLGEWEGKGDMGKVSLSYELIAGGTALVSANAPTRPRKC